MSSRRTPVSRRDRPAKAALSRAGVVAVGLRIMREEGLEKVTMRRLAAELDTGPASLYVYVQNAAELHGAMLDELLADLPLPEVGQQAWRERLVRLLCDYTALLLRYPSLARSVLSLRPGGPHFLRFLDVLLGLLDAGGVPLRQAAWGVDLLLLQATALAADHGTRRESPDDVDTMDSLVAAVQEASAVDLPNLGRARVELFTGDGRQRTRWLFDALVEGIARHPTPSEA